jgi:hypothetical protein
VTILPPISKFPEVEQPDASRELANIYKDIQGTMRVPWVPFAVQVLAAWPDVLRIAVEDILAPVALIPQFEETARRIRAIARKHVAGFSQVGGVSRSQLSDALKRPDIAGLMGVRFMYSRSIADITVAMIRAKLAFDGATSATANPFPVTDHTKREGG